MEATLKVLEEEAVNSFKIFELLHEDHIQKLLGRIPFGQHALLTELWQKNVVESEFIVIIQVLCWSPLCNILAEYE